MMPVFLLESTDHLFYPGLRYLFLMDISQQKKKRT